jgi:hypothetical protein
VIKQNLNASQDATKMLDNAKQRNAAVEKETSTPTHLNEQTLGLSWFEIFRLGLVQTALGAIVVLTTSTINRVMVVETATPAMLPRALRGACAHRATKFVPRWGHRSDIQGTTKPLDIAWHGSASASRRVGFAALATSVLDSQQSLGIALCNPRLFYDWPWCRCKRNLIACAACEVGCARRAGRLLQPSSG